MGKRFIIGIAGGSGSGKTTFARRMLNECRRIGIKGLIFSLDNYYKPLAHLSFEQRKAYNFDHPRAIDFKLAREQLDLLCRGKTVDQPIYDFRTHSRKKETTTLHSTELVVVEGLYALYHPDILAAYDYRIFIATGIATAVLRRIQRDIQERGRDLEGAKHQILTTVLPMYETYVKPTQKNAHFSIDWNGEEIPEKATEGLVRMLRDHFR